MPLIEVKLYDRRINDEVVPKVIEKMNAEGNFKVLDDTRDPSSLDKLPKADQVARCCRQRHVQRDDVGTGEQRIECMRRSRLVGPHGHAR